MIFLEQLLSVLHLLAKLCFGGFIIFGTNYSNVILSISRAILPRQFGVR